jgi:myo-inositol-1(or 4)-monophosphatase
MFCVSIAFINQNKPLIGVIYAPFINQFFSSCAGRGAFLNETQRLPLIRNVAMGSFDIWWEGGCWEWYVITLSSIGSSANERRDVAAGVAILLEAGGLMTTANPPPNEATAPIEDVKLGSRLYLAIR